MTHHTLARSLAALTLTLSACSSDCEPDAGEAPSADAGPADAGEVADAGPVDAGEVADAGPADAGGIDPSAEPYRTLREQGPSGQRLDIVIVGDGYTLDELGGRYADHVAKLVPEMFERKRNAVTEPFRRYRSFFNVHRVHLASPESGIDEGDEERDTALDGRDTCGGGVGPCYVDPDKVHAAIDAALAGTEIVPDWRVVVLNTDEKVAGVVEDPRGNIAVYPGGFGGNAVHLPRELGLREMARAFCNVHYEYEVDGQSYTGGELEEANVTTDASGAKWAHWDGYDVEDDGLGPVGAFLGGAGYQVGVYRPTEESKMGPHETGGTNGFNAVTREAVLKGIYEHVPLVLSKDPAADAVTDPLVLFVQSVDRDRTRVEWTVDGEAVPGRPTTRSGSATGWGTAAWRPERIPCPRGSGTTPAGYGARTAALSRTPCLGR